MHTVEIAGLGHLAPFVLIIRNRGVALGPLALREKSSEMRCKLDECPLPRGCPRWDDVTQT
jgi:hypothetical protein